MSSRSVYYFYIKQCTYNGIYGTDGDRYIGVVKLGLLTDDEADDVFQGALRRFIQSVDNYPDDCEPEYVISRNEPRFLEIEKCEYEETYYHEWTEYTLKSEKEVDRPTVLEWDMKWDSFFRRRYKDSLRQLDEENFDALTPETILVAAFYTAELIRKRQRTKSEVGTVCPQSENLVPLLERAEVVRDTPHLNTKNVGGLPDPTEIDIDEMLKTILSLPAPTCGKKGDTNWVHSGVVVKHLGLELGTLTKYRSEGIKTENGFAGVDKFGRAWRKRNATAHVFYYRPTVDMSLQTIDSESQTIDSALKEP